MHAHACVGLAYRKDAISYKVNASPYVSKPIQKQSIELGCDLLLQPSYLDEFVAQHYYLFISLQKFLDWMNFNKKA